MAGKNGVLNTPSRVRIRVGEAQRLSGFAREGSCQRRLAVHGAQHEVVRRGAARGELEHRRFAGSGDELKVVHRLGRVPFVGGFGGHVLPQKRLGGDVFLGRSADGEAHVVRLKRQRVDEHRAHAGRLSKVATAQLIGHGVEKRRTEPCRAAAAALGGRHFMLAVGCIEAHPHRQRQIRRVGRRDRTRCPSWRRRECRRWPSPGRCPERRRFRACR